MFCTNCGSKMEESGKFCENCGTGVGSASFPEASANPGYATQVQGGYNTGMGQQPQGGYNQGFTGQQAQPYFGNFSGNMQNTAYLNNAPPLPRKYSHSLTLALIAVGIFFLFFIPLFTVIVVFIGFILSVAALVLGAVHLTKRSCAVGGFVLGIIMTLFYLVFLISVLVVFSTLL